MSQQAGSQSTGSGGPDHKVDYVFVVSRHGQRTPVTQCRLLVKTNPEDYGELTAKGRDQCRALGVMLKQRYRTLFAGQPGEVRASQNIYRRTAESVCATMQGLGIKGVTPVKDETDYAMMYSASIAGRYFPLRTTQCRGQFKTVGQMVDFVCEKTGSETDPEKVAMQALESLITHVSNGHPIPDWAKPLWEDILWADNQIFEMSLVDAEAIMASVTLKEILNTLEEKYVKKVQRPEKMYLFSTSDIVLFSFIKLLSSSYHERPPFCSTLIIEVCFEKGSVDTRTHLLYSRELTPVPLQLDKIPNPCSLNSLMTELRRVVSSW